MKMMLKFMELKGLLGHLRYQLKAINHFVLVYNHYGFVLYLAVSAEPLSPPTVEHLTASGVRFPISLKSLALVYFVMSWVTSK